MMDSTGLFITALVSAVILALLHLLWTSPRGPNLPPRSGSRRTIFAGVLLLFVLGVSIFTGFNDWRPRTSDPASAATGAVAVFLGVSFRQKNQEYLQKKRPPWN